MTRSMAIDPARGRRACRERVPAVRLTRSVVVVAPPDVERVLGAHRVLW
ncbi:hypothetical protein ACFPM0_33850 [Pseudonocardia sulfidoxydans]